LMFRDPAQLLGKLTASPQLSVPLVACRWVLFMTSIIVCKLHSWRSEHVINHRNVMTLVIEVLSLTK
jgi:hypothetical protein